jgi:hypothetical protein
MQTIEAEPENFKVLMVYCHIADDAEAVRQVALCLMITFAKKYKKEL